MGSGPRNSNRATKRTPRRLRTSKPASGATSGKEPAEALSELSTAIALVETVSFAMRSHEHEPDFGSIAASLEVAVGRLGTAYSEIDLALMRATS